MAVRTIYAQYSAGGIFEFIRHIEQPWELGAALGQSELADGEEDTLLREYLAANDDSCRLFARGFVVGCIRSRNRTWAEGKFINLVASKEVAEQRIAALEWGFLPLLERRYKRTLRLLHRELARDPDFFSELINLAFCAEGEEPQELSEEEQMRAHRAYDLLKSWRTVPGMAEGGNIDAEMLKSWVWTARKATTASGRGVVGDQIIGQTLSGSPSDADGAWPHSAVCAVIEEVASRELEDGFELSVRTSRGTVVKHPYAGGASERRLAEQYSGFALALSDRWPRTAAMLRRISEQYRAEARREDQEAELREDLAR